MLNAVVEVDLSQVECVPLVIFLQHSYSEVGHKQADAWRGIEGSVDLARKFVKPDVSTVMWEDSCQKQKKNSTNDEI